MTVSLAFGILTLGVSAQATEINENALIVGSGAASWRNRNVGTFPQALVTAYALDDQSELLSFEAYPSHVGAQVATGDMDGDGAQEIVTLPFRSRLSPAIKTFNLSGELETATVVPRRNDIRLKRYHLAVGDVNGDGQDDVVISNAAGDKVYFDVLTMENGSFTLLAHYDNATNGELLFHYRRGSWVEVSNLDSDGGAEIITTPERQGSGLDVFSYADGEISIIPTAYLNTGFAFAAHIAALNDAVLMAEHSETGTLKMYLWSTDDEDFIAGSLDSLTSDTEIGTVGDIAWFDSGTFAYSQFNEKLVTYQHYDASGATDTVNATIDVNSRGAFVDFVNVD